MNTHSDSFVFFGATGDLAYKQIFPALQTMMRRDDFDMPVIGVAKAGWNLPARYFPCCLFFRLYEKQN